MCSVPALATLCGLCHTPVPPLAEAQRLPYYATYCPTRLLIHSMCTSHYLDIFITFVICLNVVTMSLEHYNQPMVSTSPAPHPPMGAEVSWGEALGRTCPWDREGQDLRLGPVPRELSARREGLQCLVGG